MFSVYQTSLEWAQQSGLKTWAEPETTSTNEVAKKTALEESEAICLFFADTQSKGRGRGSHTWTSPSAGTALLTSWSFMMHSSPHPVLSPAMGLALFKAASLTWLGFDWSLKAPNDLYLGNKKVAGLLLETIQEGSQQRFILGLGMNIFSHPKVDRSGSLVEQIPEAEICPEVWRQFLDRFLLETTATMMLTSSGLTPGQRRGLLFALNQFPDQRGQYLSVQSDGKLETTKGEMQWP